MQSTIDLAIVVGASATIFSILGGFLLTFGLTLREKKRESDLKIQNYYLELFAIQKKTVSPSLCRKISNFENAHLDESTYLNEVIEFKNLKYTTTFDFYSLQRSKKRNKRLLKVIENYYEFIIYSKDFNSFQNYSCIFIWGFDRNKILDAYLINKRFMHCYEYIKYLDNNAVEYFSEAELKIYLKYQLDTQKIRDAIFDLQVLSPSLKNQKMSFIGIIYLISIAFLGVFDPIFNEDVPLSTNLILVFLLTCIYISINYMDTFTNKYTVKLKGK